jgi:hypothetical protein
MANSFESELRAAVEDGVVSAIQSLVERERLIAANEVQSGLKGEEIVNRGISSGIRHTNGPREARRAQQQ